MNDITAYNFFQLLAAGAFNNPVQIEPMSAHKWRVVLKLAAAHEVANYMAAGLQRNQEDFFLQIPVALEESWKNWETTASADDDEERDDSLTAADHLTNPILNRTLQRVRNSEEVTEETQLMLQLLITITRQLMNEGIPVRQIIELGILLRTKGDRVDYVTLQQWLEKLRMTKMAEVAAALLIQFFNFTADEIPFLDEQGDIKIGDIVDDVFQKRDTTHKTLYFSQGDDIFVHASNTSALLGHIKRSAKYFKYYPSESITNFFASFVHSLSHIEE